jgi:hypothetical protein
MIGVKKMELTHHVRSPLYGTERGMMSNQQAIKSKSPRGADLNNIFEK